MNQYIYNIMNHTVITYGDLSRDFQLISIAPINVTSIKHRILLTAKQAGGIWWCAKCDSWVDGYDDHPCQKRNELEFIGTQCNLKIRIYNKMTTGLCFVIEKIEGKFGMNMPIWTVYNVFAITKIHWWTREDEFSKQICDDFVSKIMIIRDFIEFDCWCYVVSIMIKSDKMREVTFA